MPTPDILPRFGEFLLLLSNPSICAKCPVRLDVWYLLSLDALPYDALDALPYDVALADRLKL
jgi:hypothetical protein